VVPGQRSLFASGEVGIDRDARWERLMLDATSWVDVCRGHLLGADAVLDVVRSAVAWECRRRRMYDRMIDDPRLSCRAGDLVPHPVLAQVRDSLAARCATPTTPSCASSPSAPPDRSDSARTDAPEDPRTTSRPDRATCW